MFFFDLICFSIFLPVSLNIYFDVQFDICIVYSCLMMLICILSVHTCKMVNIYIKLSYPSDDVPMVDCLVCRFLRKNPTLHTVVLYNYYGLLATFYVSQTFLKNDMDSPLFIFSVSLLLYFPISFVVAILSLRLNTSP